MNRARIALFLHECRRARGEWKSSHRRNLDALFAQSSDTSGPFSFDRGPPFELEAEFTKEINRPSEVFDDDSYVVHPLERHVSNLQDVAPNTDR